MNNYSNRFGPRDIPDGEVMSGEIFFGSAVWKNYTNEPIRPDPGDHVVYAHFTVDDILLYVGYTADMDRRTSQHARHAPWWRHRHHTKLIFFADRDSALDAELEVIRSEAPMWNKKGAPV